MRDDDADRIGAAWRAMDPDRAILEHNPHCEGGCPLCNELDALHLKFFDALTSANAGNPAVSVADLVILLCRTLAELLVLSTKPGKLTEATAGACELLTTMIGDLKIKQSANTGNAEMKQEIASGMRKLRDRGQLDPVIEIIAKGLGIDPDNVEVMVASPEDFNALRNNATIAQQPLSDDETAALNGFSPEAMAMLRAANNAPAKGKPS